MKVYVVTADIYKGMYGASIYLFGVYSTEEKALKVIKDNKIYGYVEEVEIDEFEKVYLGGYVE